VVVQLVASMFNCIQVVRMEKRWILVLCKTRSLQNPSQWGSKMVESKMVHTLTKTAVKTIKNLGVLDILTHKLFTFWPKPRGFLEMFPPKYQPKVTRGTRVSPGAALESSNVGLAFSAQGRGTGSSSLCWRWVDGSSLAEKLDDFNVVKPISTVSIHPQY